MCTNQTFGFVLLTLIGLLAIANVFSLASRATDSHCNVPLNDLLLRNVRNKERTFTMLLNHRSNVYESVTLYNWNKLIINRKINNKNWLAIRIVLVGFLDFVRVQLSSKRFQWPVNYRATANVDCFVANGSICPFACHFEFVLFAFFFRPSLCRWMCLTFYALTIAV